MPLSSYTPPQRVARRGSLIGQSLKFLESQDVVSFSSGVLSCRTIEE